jgi:hypothetical protein
MLKKLAIALVVTSTMGFGCAGSASADTINFGQFSGTVANGSTGVTTGGVSFTLTGPGTGFQVLEQDVSWAGNFPNNTPVLFDCYGSGPVTFDFTTPIDNISKIAIESNLYGAFVATLLAYDGTTLLGSQTVSGVSGYAPNTAPAFDFSALGITSVVISTTNDSVGFGLGGVGGTGGYAGTPEPSTWVMMLLGFAGLSFAAYRQTKRKNGVAFSAA